MSGQQRKVSRGIFDSSSGFVTSSTDSRTRLTQPENELKQKLDAIDTSIKVSNKKINSETRELRKILYDLQRDLKVSKSVSHYVPSPIEEQETKAKRVRRVTVGAEPRERHSHDQSEHFSKSLAKDGRIEEVTQGISTKRRRKTSVPPIYKSKILVKEDDVDLEKKQSSDNNLLQEKELEVGKIVVGSLENKEVLKEHENVVSTDCDPQQEEQTGQCKQTNSGVCVEKDQERDLSYDENDQTKPRIFPSSSSKNDEENTNEILGDVRNDSCSRNALHTNVGMPSYTSEAKTPKGNSTEKFGRVASYSKYMNEERRSSLSESEAVKCRFVTSSLSEGDKLQNVLPPPDKRTRRVTVAGILPGGARGRLDIGDIPVTPFRSGSRRISVNSTQEVRRKKSTSLGREPIGGLLPRRDQEESTLNSDVFTDNLLTSRTHDTQRYRRPSSIRKPSLLPPLKEEQIKQKASNVTAISNEWKNLENCRYLRKEDMEISIEDIFKKD